MDPATILVGIQLAKKSFEAVKNSISTAKDIGCVVDDINNFFEGASQVREVARKKSNSIASQIGLRSVVEEEIQKKLLKEKEQELSTLINMRFGPGTWGQIMKIRAERIKQAKAEARQKQIERQKQLEDLAYTLLVIVGVIVGAGLIIFAFEYL